MEQIILNRIKEGSIVYTDGWAGYSGISSLPNQDYQHEVVNHSVEFTRLGGIHTNGVEGNIIVLYIVN